MLVIPPFISSKISKMFLCWVGWVLIFIPYSVAVSCILSIMRWSPSAELASGYCCLVICVSHCFDETASHADTFVYIAYKSSLSMASAYILKNTGESEHPCLVPRPVTAAFVKPSFTHSLALCPIYNLSISRRSRQLTPMDFRTSRSFTKLTLSKAFP